MSSKPAKTRSAAKTSNAISSQIEKSQPQLFLNELELGVTGLIIVMICRMWDVNTSTGRYLSTEFIVSDAKGNIMHCVAKSNVAHTFLKLKEGDIYSVKNFGVQPNKEDFRILKNADLMLEFDGATIVRRAYTTTQGFVRYPFQFVDFDDLEVTNNKYTIDVVGYVTNVGRTTHQKSGSRSLDFYLGNSRGQSVRVMLWGSLGDVLIEKRTCHVGLYPVVLTAMSVKVYNNRLYLSSTSSTMIIDDPAIPVVKQLKTYDNGVERTKESLPMPADTAPKEGTLENLLMWARNQRYDSVTFHCSVTIDNVRTRKGWNYPACGGEKCKKGNVNRKDGHFWCDSCNQTVKYPILRYRLELEVSDETAQVVVVMFDETATELVKFTAESIVSLDDEGADDHPELPQPLANIIGTTHILELKSHTYFVHQNFESFTCWQIVAAEEVEETPASPIVEHITVSPDVNPKETAFSILVKAPEIATPSKASKDTKKKREELEDSDAEHSFAVDSRPTDGAPSSSSDIKKKRRVIVDESD